MPSRVKWSPNSISDYSFTGMLLHVLHERIMVFLSPSLTFLYHNPNRVSVTGMALRTDLRNCYAKYRSKKAPVKERVTSGCRVFAPKFRPPVLSGRPREAGRPRWAPVAKKCAHLGGPRRPAPHQPPTCGADSDTNVKGRPFSC